MSKIIYLKGLNGIRAIAAMAVLFAHITLALDQFGLNPHLFGTYDDGTPRTLDLAGYGVSMFFALSGFLITYLLLLEKEKSNINIRKFYMRRILRIWPLYYGYLVLTLVALYFLQIDYEYSSIKYYVFYSANVPFILGISIPALVHFWSLGVEEQFYLFWPWLNRMNNRKTLITILFLTTFLLGLKIYLHLFIPNTILENTIHVSRFHCMMIGALAAFLYYGKNQKLMQLATHQIIQLIAWICLLMAAINRFHIASFLDNEFITIITTIIILGQVSAKGLFSLENKIMHFIGKISYGIYVVHPLIILLFTRTFTIQLSNTFFSYLLVYGLFIALTIIVSYLSYTYFERPFLRLKHRFSIIHSSNERTTN